MRSVTCMCLDVSCAVAAAGCSRRARDVRRARASGDLGACPRVRARCTARQPRASPFTTDVLAGPVVTDAPFSADATTTVTQVLGDGTRIEQTTTARFFRDRAGRVRREQTILGLGALNAGGNMQTITIAPDPGDGTAYTLDPMTRTARRVPRMAIATRREHGRRSAQRRHVVYRARAHWRTAAWRCGGNSPTEEIARRAAVRRRQSPRPKDDDDHSDRADRQRPADRDHRRAMGVARAENAGLLAQLRPSNRRRRVPADQHQPGRAARGSLHDSLGLHGHLCHRAAGAPLAAAPAPPGMRGRGARRNWAGAPAGNPT